MIGRNKGRYAAGTVRDFSLSAALSAALLSVASLCSPLYPFNYWVDANCFFTVGKAMLRGMVPYRDLYEQKGPLLYFLHGLASLVSWDGFFGVYLLEVLALACFLMSAVYILRLFVPCVPWAAPAGLGAAVVTSASFALGDSAEELCLPLLSWSLYALLKAFRQSDQSEKFRISLPCVMLHGFLAGCVLWMKYTMLGFYVGWLTVFCLSALLERGLFAALKTALAFLLGVFGATVPWLIYFAAHRALHELWRVYFYNNIFLYPQTGNGLGEIIRRGMEHLWSGLEGNPGYALPAAAGMLWVLFYPSLPAGARAGVPVTFGLLAAGVFGGGRVYAYYSLIFGVYGTLGLIPLLRLIRPPAGWQGRAALRALAAAGVAVCLVLAYTGGNDTNLLGEPRQAVLQYRFAEEMHRLDDAPTLLNYGFLDGGFYTAAGILPTCRYFCTLNLPLEEMQRIQNDCLRAGAVKFVVTRDRELDAAVFGRYELLAQEEFYGARYSLYRLSS